MINFDANLVDREGKRTLSFHNHVNSSSRFSFKLWLIFFSQPNSLIMRSTPTAVSYSCQLGVFTWHTRMTHFPLRPAREHQSAHHERSVMHSQCEEQGLRTLSIFAPWTFCIRFARYPGAGNNNTMLANPTIALEAESRISIFTRHSQVNGLPPSENNV